MKQLILILLVVFIFAACQPMTVIVEKEVPIAVSTPGAPNIVPYINTELGIVCLVYIGTDMECLPIYQTYLADE